MKKHSFAIIATLLLLSLLFTACKSKWTIDPDKPTESVSTVSFSSASTVTSASDSAGTVSSDTSSSTEISGSETSTEEPPAENTSIAITIINLTEYKTGDIFVASFDMDLADPSAELPGPYGHVKELDTMSTVKVTMDWPKDSDELFFYLYNVAGERVLVTKQGNMSSVTESVLITIKFNDSGELRVDVTVK